MKLNIRLKLGLLTISLVVITSILVAAVYYQKLNTLLTENTLELLGHEVAHESKRLTTKTDKVRKDVLYLARMPSVETYVNKTTKQSLKNIRTSFINLLQVEPDYLQIRFIDADGQERVRAERDNQQVVSTPANQLQDKSQLSYVIDTLGLSRGEIYFSSINLNREHGKIALPHTPVIRVATPLFNDKHQVAGMIIINLDFGRELEKLKTYYSQQGDTIYITDHQGGYLLHPQPHKAFGSDLGHRYRLQEDFPYVAEIFVPGKNIQQQTILPHDEHHGHGSDASIFVKVQLDDKNPERYIVIGIARNYQAIIATQYQTLAESSILVILLIILSVLLAIWFSRRLTQPLQRITLAIDNFSSGQPDISLPVERTDELGVLARHFNALFYSVKNAQLDLKNLNATLEQQVKQRTEELSRFKNTLDQTLDAVYMIRPETMKFFYVNNGAIKQTGYSYNELLCMTPLDLNPGISTTEFKQIVESMQEGETDSASFETTQKHKNAKPIPVEIFLQYVNPENEEPRFVAIVRDITERKKVDRMKNEFISTVSHELRTPLTSIRGSLGLLVGGAAGNMAEQEKSLLDIAHKNTERLLLLINDILDISKIESGKMEFKFRELNLKQFLNQAIEANADYGNQYQVCFEIKGCLENVTIYADPDRLHQVMNNLMSNAAKFSPPGTTVTISVSINNQTVRVAVTDQGCGIPEEIHNTIFNRFVQADSSDTRQAGGTGLGLNIARAIIHKHHGQIDFNSEPGKGATFFFDLPIQPANVQPNHQLTQADSLTVRRVLICEDDTDIAELLGLILQQHGYTADIAHSVNETRQLLASNQYHAMTLDIMLAEESGITLFEEIRDNPATRELPIIMISAIADETRKQLNGGAIGVIDWLTKPIDQQRLIASMDTVFHDADHDKPRILHIEDEDDVITYIKVLFKNKADIIAASSVAAAKQALKTDTYSLVILDIGLPDGTGLELLPIINSMKPTPPIVIFSAQDIDTAIAHEFSDILIKSRASNEQLFNTIISYLEMEPKALN